MLSNSGVKNGIFLAISIAIFSHVCYLINPKMMLSGVAYLTFVITIFFMWRSASSERKKNEGLLSFGDALKVTFITYIIGTLASSIHTYVMFNFIDPSLTDVLKEVTLDNAKMVAKIMGTEDQIDLMQDQIESQDIQMTLSMTFLGYLGNLIFPGFIFALIISAITKKESA